MAWFPSFQCVTGADGGRSWRVGHDQVDEFLEFAHGRVRPNTVRAYAHDLTVFFSIVAKEPVEVTPRDVLEFVAAQQRPRQGAENVLGTSIPRVMPLPSIRGSEVPPVDRSRWLRGQVGLGLRVPLFPRDGWQEAEA